MDITLLTCTHGRPYFLVEAVECFKRMTVPQGVTAEHLLFNSCPDQTLSCAVPGVRVVNTGAFRTLSEVMNAGMEEARGDWVAILDDDDISLPFRFDESWDFVSIRPSIRAMRHKNAWIWERGKIVGRERNLYIGSAFLRRDFYFNVGGAGADAYWDIDIWNKMTLAGGTLARSPTSRRTHFIYRWAGMGFHHSGLADGSRSQEELDAIYREKVKSDPRFVPGEIEIVPEWKQDYVALVQQAIDNRIGETTT